MSERDLAYVVAQAVAERRIALGWSQRRLADEAGMKQPHISRLESATKLPQLSTVLRLANAMGARLVIDLKEPEQP